MLLRTTLRLFVLSCASAAVLAGTALSEPAKTKVRIDDDATALITSRTEKADGTTAMSFGRRLATDWDTKVGVDVGIAAPLSSTPSVEYHLDGPAARDQSSGSGWASITLPAAPPGWDKAAVDARIDPLRDHGKVTTTLSRSVPVGDTSRVTVKNGYAITEAIPSSISGSTLANANPSAQPVEATIDTHGSVSLDILPSATTVSAGTKLSSAEDRWLHSLSAEQKLFGGPVSVTGSVHERSDGGYDGSLKAGFKRAW